LQRVSNHFDVASQSKFQMRGRQYLRCLQSGT
jgi:hypothetical protein